MSNETNVNERSVASDCSTACPGFTSIWEWIDYWCAGNEQFRGDRLSIDEMRSDLAWASQTINHLLSALRDIHDHRLKGSPDHCDAVTVATNALQEYGLVAKNDCGNG